jgi:hypothetical protein
MLDLIAEGMAIRNQLPIQTTVAVSETNPQPSATIRSYPQIGNNHRNSGTMGHPEDYAGAIRKSAVSATPAIFELSINAFNNDGLELTHDDLIFLRHHLPFDPSHRDAALARYREIWHEAMTEEPAGHRKQNKGRFVANTWLRTTNLKALSPKYFEKKEI